MTINNIYCYKMPVHQGGYKIVKGKRYGCYQWGGRKKYWYRTGRTGSF